MNGTGPKTNTNNAKFAQALQKKCFQMPWEYSGKSFEFEYLGEITIFNTKLGFESGDHMSSFLCWKKKISNKFPASLSIRNFRNVLRGQKIIIGFTRKLFVCLLKNYSKFTCYGYLLLKLCTSVIKKTIIPLSACIQAGNLHKQWTLYIKRLYKY